MTLAKTAEINRVSINQVMYWDGEEDLIEKDEEDDDDMMLDSEAPAPPVHVLEVYNEATSTIKMLQDNPQNVEILDYISSKLNGRIAEINKETGLPEGNWHIDGVRLATNYTWALQHYNDLIRYPDDSEPREKLQDIKNSLDKLIATRHYPTDWSISDNFVETAKQEVAKREVEKQKAAEAEKQKAEEAAKRAAQPASKDAEGRAAEITAAATKAGITYSWVTGVAGDGARILAARKQGFGYRVCVETLEDGRLIRRVISGSEAGVPVASYIEHKDMKADRKKWTPKIRSKFRELHWITDTSLYKYDGRKTAPESQCCVTMDWGIDLCPASSLISLLGSTRAKAEINRVCRRDGIETPWEGFECGERKPRGGTLGKRRGVEGNENRRRSPSRDSLGEDSEVEEMVKRVDDLESRLSEVDQMKANMKGIQETLASILQQLAALAPKP